MKKTKSDQKPRTMLDQEEGSMLDKKTNEDFNNEHPDHDESGLSRANPNSEDKDKGTIIKKYRQRNDRNKK